MTDFSRQLLELKRGKFVMVVGVGSAHRRSFVVSGINALMPLTPPPPLLKLVFGAQWRVLKRRYKVRQTGLTHLNPATGPRTRTRAQRPLQTDQRNDMEPPPKHHESTWQKT